jgi:hypothetical protein
MNQDIKQRWVDALRSGEYEQGKECLHDSSDNTFCCLGVLTDLYIKEHGQQWHKPDGATHLTFEDEGGVLPSSVRTWAGLVFGSCSPYVSGRDLASHNDNGMSFDELAQLIENEL